MSNFIIEGGLRLEGTAAVHGAKNSVLPLLAATLLAPGESVLRNCPRLSDVAAEIRILEQLGCTVKREGDALIVDATAPTSCAISEELMREMRSSVIFLGALLARMGQAELFHPGGCSLGPRPIDLHLSALRALGAEIREEGGSLNAIAPRLRGREITLALPSVGATENIMLAACGAEGTTVLCNAAREPEIVDLQQFLQSMGATVRGAGSSVITIEGRRPLCGGCHRVMPDRIVAATYLSAAAAAGGRVLVTGVDYRHLSAVTAVLVEAGCTLRSEKDSIYIARSEPLRAVRPVRTAPHPGFPTDAQPPLMAALARSQGATVFVETMFDGRYHHVDELSRMGACIRTEGRVAVVCGVPELWGAAVRAADLRGGAALVVAALCAQGESRVSGLDHIDRGYEDLDGVLRALGARIVREDDER